MFYTIYYLLLLLINTFIRTGVLWDYPMHWFSDHQTYLVYGHFDSSDIPLSKHPVFGDYDRMYPYIFRQVYLKVCTHTSSDRSTSRYVPIHLQTGLPQGMYPYIFKQVYLKVCLHTSSDRSTSRYVPTHLQTGLPQRIYLHSLSIFSLSQASHL